MSDRPCSGEAEWAGAPAVHKVRRSEPLEPVARRFSVGSPSMSQRHSLASECALAARAPTLPISSSTRNSSPIPSTPSARSRSAAAIWAAMIPFASQAPRPYRTPSSILAGVCDAKGIMAAQIAAAERLRAEGVDGIGLLFVVDEEMGSVGARAANAHSLARECRWLIDGEPTENRLATGSKGSLRLTLCTAGVPAHSAYPEHGRSAIDALLEVLGDVRRATWPTDPVFGETTVNIGVIAGGTRPNVVAADARADLQLRLVTEAAPVKALLERAVRDRARIDYLTAVPPLRLATVPGFEPQRR